MAAHPMSPSSPARLRPRWRRRTRPGIVIVIALVGMMLMAAMVFYVFNTGSQLQKRIETQQAADAAALASATQMARTFNVVAVNNETMARMVALVNILDAVPMAVDFTVRDEEDGYYGDLDAVLRVAQWQLGRGVSSAWSRRMLERLRDRSQRDSLINQAEQLRELQQLFEANPNLIPNITHYNAPNGQRGTAWQVMENLDAINRVMMQQLDDQMQQAAMQSGQWNMDQEQSMALGLPMTGQIPWIRGHFHDFERPVRHGLLPGTDPDNRLASDTINIGHGQIDDAMTNRGPFDAIYGWRHYDGHNANAGGWIPGPGNAPVGVPPTGRRQPTFYRPFGMLSWMRWQIPWSHYSPLRRYLNNLSNTKMRYVWPGQSLQQVNRPMWEIDVAYDGERAEATNERSIATHTEGGPRIRRTMYICTEIKSRIANNPGELHTQGLTWNYIQRRGHPQPFLVRRRGWRNPENGPPMRINSTTPVQWRQTGDYVWQASATYEVVQDPTIGLLPVITGRDSNGRPIYRQHTVHWEMEFFLVGVDFGEPIAVSNPYAGFNPNVGPAPIDLMQPDMLWDSQELATSPRLGVLGIAEQPNPPRIWPDRFGQGRLHDRQVAIAQAHVFNNHSRDLWTAMWHAQLAPVTDYDRWVDLLDTALASGQIPDGLSPGALEALARYLRSLELIAPTVLTH